MNDNDFEKMLLETCGCPDGDGIEVFMQNIAKIHEYSGEVLGMIQNHQEMEDWIEDKVSKAAQSLSDVKHYLEYRSTAYAVQQHGAGPAPDSGERMPVMTQSPEMTPPSSMSLQGVFMPDEEEGGGEDYGDYGGGEPEEDVVVGGTVDDPMTPLEDEGLEDTGGFVDDEEDEIAEGG